MIFYDYINLGNGNKITSDTDGALKINNNILLMQNSDAIKNIIQNDCSVIVHNKLIINSVGNITLKFVSEVS